MIRAAAIIQALLGNIGRPGGGILALRGHSQHPGQHRHPDALQHAARLSAAAARAQAARDARRTTSSTRRRRPAGGTTSRSTRSACCAPGTASTRRRTTTGATSGAEDRRRSFAAADDAGDRSTARSAGCLLIGQNPVIGGSNSRPDPARPRRTSSGWWCATSFETETASFWYASASRSKRASCGRRTSRPKSSCCRRALPGEKEGTFTNTHRLVQWHDKIVDRPATAAPISGSSTTSGGG